MAAVAFSAATVFALVPVSMREGVAHPGKRRHVQSTTYRFVHRSYRPRVSVVDQIGAWTEIRSHEGDVLGHVLTQAQVPVPILYLPYYPYLCVFPEDYSPGVFVALSLASAGIGWWMLHIRRRASPELHARTA